LTYLCFALVLAKLDGKVTTLATSAFFIATLVLVLTQAVLSWLHLQAANKYLVNVHFVKALRSSSSNAHSLNGIQGLRLTLALRWL
jgi:hypothetical protein